MEQIHDAEIVRDEGARLPATIPVAPTTVTKTTEEEFDLEIAALIPQAGTIVLTDDQRATLYAPVPDDIIEIRPDGLIYLPWMEYVDRLTRTFGMEWGVVPKGQPKYNPTKSGIIWGFYLIIKGKLAGYAIGEQAYYENNGTMTWGDACEGAKSNALMRLCKGIGIGLKLWQPSFVRGWRAKYAESYWEKNKRGELKEYWRKTGAERGKEENGSGAEQKPAPPAPPSPPSATPKEQKAPILIRVQKSDGKYYNEPLADVYANLKKMRSLIGDEKYYEKLSAYKCSHANELPHAKLPEFYADVLKFMSGGALRLHASPGGGK